MKVIKPQRVGVLHRVFENGRDPYLVVSTLLFVPLTEPRRLLSEISLWKTAQSELGVGAVLDEGMPKPRGEFLTNGIAYAAQRPCTATQARVKVGPLDKSIYVIGNRTWQRTGASDPETFTEMPIGWENAFGGPGYAQNPLGKGYFGKGARSDDKAGQDLPNIEEPVHLIASKSDRPEPAGFGRLDMSWPQRKGKTGTYDSKWLKERFPGFAADLDLGFFNVAPSDQQLPEGYFAGNESYTFENLHPSIPILTGELPGLCTRVFITQRKPSDERFKELETRLDTLHFFPSVDRCLLVFRSMTRIEDDDAGDVSELMVACEERSAPKTTEHYREVLAHRLDLKEAHRYVLLEGDLLPWEDDQPVADDTEHRALVAREDLHAQNLRRGRELHPKPAHPVVTAALEAGTEPPETPSRKLPAAVVDEANRASAGPPRFDARRELEATRGRLEKAHRAGIAMPDVEALLADPGYLKRLEQTQEKLRDRYRGSGHLGHPAAALSELESQTLRARVVAALVRGESLRDADLTGCDLSEIDLRKADLRGAFMESANLRGARFDGANLSRTMLARADLTGASLVECDLRGANLGQAELERARLDRTQLTGAILEGCKLEKTSLSGASIDGASLMDADLSGVDWSGFTARNVRLTRCRLEGARLTGSDWEKCNFIECDMTECLFEGARLERANFVETKLDGSSFASAHLVGVRVVLGSTAPRCDFRAANLEKANLRETNLEKCDFERAILNGADLSECNLRSANFYRSTAKEARFVRSDCAGANFTSSNLMLAIFQKANLMGTQFVGANLFRADLAQVIGDHQTSFSDANVAHVRYVDRPKTERSPNTDPEKSGRGAS